MPQFEFHISRQSRQNYQFDQTLFSLSGNVIFADFSAARLFAQKMNVKRHPEQAVRAGHIHAMGLIDEILHLLARQYRLQTNPLALEKALVWLEKNVGALAVDAALLRFVEEFPPVAVYRGELSLEDYLQGRSDGLLNRQIALEELLMLWLANANPAFNPYAELFDDQTLIADTAYSQIVKGLGEFFETQPRFGSGDQTLIEVLRGPALAAPDSLEGQLDFIREQWSVVLGEYLQRLLKGLDFIKEETKPSFFGPGPAQVPEYPSPGSSLTGDYPLFEEERFSPDSDWMPRLVLLAKNTYVWLDQMSKDYQREIKRLDQVPDAELDKLAGWGFTGLWLIGLWERSAASQRIKQLCGNPDAVSSAYSLYDYTIANDLGGEVAYNDLRHRAWQRGIRVAADMVPNHVGIYSKWVVERPDWFVALDEPPFPTYSFNGENLSHDERVGIYIDDHYYDKTDAAVVFKRVDQWTGDTKYIYHGNDGTAMPWNDTAQLDYLNPEVRETVIQTILHVARQFPVIRFDAAMTLAKKHFQRLWFPQPGTGGDIPSRAEYGLTREQFDAAMPLEFWREVVDRVAKEVPDTLLLAEAFWMMEGYFVRTLGMHRVYNSAFMNMLRDEKNAEYRQLIKNTLEFDPQILKRYVNFMNNPDEETAIHQFGNGDKYFGICTLMSTLPGLPMFGHGQVEGFHEKYGMEYRRAYWDEYPDTHLVDRHKQQVFPLLHRRAQFAEVENFFLYDFYTPHGQVDENVFAYSNIDQGQRSLVIYHNCWADTRGWLKASAAYLDKASDELRQTHLAEGLALDYAPNIYTIFRDYISGLEYIRANAELHERGLYIELGAYKHQVFVDFRQVADTGWGQYRQLAEYLDGRGTPNIEETMQEILLQPLLTPFRELVNPAMFEHLLTCQPATLQPTLDEIEQKMLRLLTEIERMTEIEVEHARIVEVVLNRLDAFWDLPVAEAGTPNALTSWLLPEEDDPAFMGVLLGWLCTHNLGASVGADEEEIPARSRELLDEWLLAKSFGQTLDELGASADSAAQGVDALYALVQHQGWYAIPGEAGFTLENWLRDADVRRLLRVNRYQGVQWFHKESFEKFLRWMLAVALIEIDADSAINETDREEMVAELFEQTQVYRAAALASDYQVEKLLAAFE